VKSRADAAQHLAPAVPPRRAAGPARRPSPAVSAGSCSCAAGGAPGPKPGPS